MQVEEDTKEALERRVVEAESTLAGAANELEKTRNLLIIQHKVGERRDWGRGMGKRGGKRQITE